MKEKKEIKIRQYARITLADWFKEEVKKSGCNPFRADVIGKGDNGVTLLAYLGESPNMRGHCMVVGWTTGKIYCGYHTEDFRELTDEES